jgi:quercetin dioxygenase-like cupin family protein
MMTAQQVANTQVMTEDEAGPLHRTHLGECRWQDVEVSQYKQEGNAPFRDITRQTLFDDPDLACQVRYFEVQPGGYSTLERHQHVHAVVVLRGSGSCLVGEEIFALGAHDLVRVPALTWHQFRASDDAALGFLCVVNAERDRPQLPDSDELAKLRAIPAVAAFLGA